MSDQPITELSEATITAAEEILFVKQVCQETGGLDQLTQDLEEALQMLADLTIRIQHVQARGEDPGTRYHNPTERRLLKMQAALRSMPG